MNDLIQIKNGTEFCVDARELHTALGIGTRFDTWWEREAPGLVEKVDYMPFFERASNYRLTIDVAKHICMLQKNDKGREIRQWFIDREKRFREIEKPRGARFLLAAAQQMVEIEDKQARLQEQQSKTAEQVKQIVTDMVETRNLAVQANNYNSGRTGFYTVRGMAQILSVKLSTEESKKVGKIAVKLSNIYGIKVQKCKDERWGEVNSYEEKILNEAFNAGGFIP